MELLDFCVWSDASGHNLLFLENIETAFQSILILAFSFILLDTNSAHSSEEYFEDRFHIIYKHFLEVLLLFLEVWVLLFLPHFIYDTLIDVPVADMR